MRKTIFIHIDEPQDKIEVRWNEAEWSEEGYFTLDILREGETSPSVIIYLTPEKMRELIFTAEMAEEDAYMRSEDYDREVSRELDREAREIANG